MSFVTALLTFVFYDLPVGLTCLALDHPYATFGLLVYALAVYGAGIRSGEKHLVSHRRTW